MTDIEKLCEYCSNLTSMLCETDRELEKLDNQFAQGKITYLSYVQRIYPHLIYIRRAYYERDCVKQEILCRCV